MATALSQRPAPKFAPKVALMQLDAPTADSLSRAFAQCGVETVLVSDDFRERLMKEQFQGCVLHLDDRALDVLQAVRSSRSNNKLIVYGIVSRNDDMRRFFKYGVNAVLDSALERSAVLHVARSTSALLLHELRRYVRIPIVVEVTVENTGQKLIGSSREISGGGMSVALMQAAIFDTGTVRLSFSLPEERPVSVTAAMCWQSGLQMGFRFQDSDSGRNTVKDWINSFLGLQ